MSVSEIAESADTSGPGGVASEPVAGIPLWRVVTWREHVPSRPLTKDECHQRDLAMRLWNEHRRILGHDGFLLQNCGDVVYVVDHRLYHLSAPLQEVDYFHGIVDDYVTAQLLENNTDVRAFDMIHPQGFVAKTMSCVQRRYRRYRSATRLCKSIQNRRLMPPKINRIRLIVFMIAIYLPR